MPALWQALESGTCGVGREAPFDTSGFPCPFVAALPAGRFDVRQVVPKNYRKATKVMARDIELAVGAAAAAVADAGLMTRATEPADGRVTIPPDRFGCHIGAGLIAAEENELTSALAMARGPDGTFDLKLWGQQGMQHLTPLWMLKYLPNMLACHVTIIHDCQGPSNTITCAEASSLLSIGESMRVIDRGSADACLSGGAESKVNLMAMLRQHFAGRMAAVPPETDPAQVVKPFAPDARGGVPGEGGGLLVLEAGDALAARGGRAIAWLEGFGASQSACADTVGLVPDPDGRGLADAMEAALHDAGAAPDSVDAIVPFGTGVPAMDAAERAAMTRVFGARLPRIPLITLAPYVGNCGAGFGAVAAAASAACLRAQRLPARLGTRGAAGLDADAVPARDAALRRILVMTPSLGGQNAAIVLGRAA